MLPKGAKEYKTARIVLDEVYTYLDKYYMEYWSDEDDDKFIKFVYKLIKERHKEK